MPARIFSSDRLINTDGSSSKYYQAHIDVHNCEFVVLFTYGKWDDANKRPLTERLSTPNGTAYPCLGSAMGSIHHQLMAKIEKNGYRGNLPTESDNQNIYKILGITQGQAHALYYWKKKDWQRLIPAFANV